MSKQKRSKTPEPVPVKGPPVLFPEFVLERTQLISEPMESGNAVLSIQAVDETGKPMNGMKFSLTSHGGEATVLTTNEAGMANYATRCGTVMLKYGFPAPFDAPKDFQTSVPLLKNRVNPVRVVFHPGANLMVVLYEELDPNPLAKDSINAQISLKGIRDPDISLTSSDSTLTLDNIPAGDYRLNVSAEGYVPQELLLSLEAGEQKEDHISIAKEAFLEIHPMQVLNGKSAPGGEYRLCGKMNRILNPVRVDEKTGVAVFRITETGLYSIIADKYPDKLGSPDLKNPVAVTSGETVKHYIWYNHDYDSRCKILFQRPLYLARVLKIAMRNTDMTVTEIANMLIQANPTTVSKDRGTVIDANPLPLYPPEQGSDATFLASYGQAIVPGLPQESNSSTEGRLNFDFPFIGHIHNWNGHKEAVKCLYNLEFMSYGDQPSVLYPRNAVYLARRMSGEKNTVFFNTDYKDVIKVHNIWIFTNPAEERMNTVLHLPQESINQLMEELVGEVVRRTLGKSTNLSCLAKIRDELGKEVAEKLAESVNELSKKALQLFASEGSPAKLPEKKTIKAVIQDQLNDQFVSMRTYLESTFIFLGPYQEAPDDEMKFLDIMLYEKLPASKRIEILKSELDITLSEDEREEVSILWDLASGLVARGREEGRKEALEEAADAYCDWYSKVVWAFLDKPWVESDIRLFAKEQNIPDYAISKIINAAKRSKISIT